MPTITKDKLRESLRKREIAPVYLFYGAERFQRDIAIKTISDLVFSKDDLRDFNETEFTLNTSEGPGAALAAAEQLPMMSAKRLVKIKDVRISATGRLDTIKDNDEALLTRFLERPPDHAVVIFIAEELNGTRKLAKLLKDKCASVEFAELTENDRIKAAEDQLKKLGFEVDGITLRHIVALAGPDLARLTNEINKLTTAVLPGRKVTREIVDELIPDRGEIGQWDFVNQLNSGQKRDALASLKKMLDDGQEPLMILGQIAGTFRRSALEGKSDTRRTAARMKLLSETDLAIKNSIGASGPAGARMQIEKLVCELTQI